MKIFVQILYFLMLGQATYSQVSKDTLLEIYHTDIYFETNQYMLSDSAKERIVRLKDTLPNIKGKFYFIAAHTDGDGSVTFNKGLSENRSNSVSAFLIEQGISSDEIQSVAYGKLKPQASNNTAEGKRLNRRTKISVLKKFRTKRLTGKIRIDELKNREAKITISGKIFNPVITTDNEGNFSTWVPLGQRLLIGAEIENYFAEPISIIVNDEILAKPLSIPTIPIKHNAVLNFKEINFEGDRLIVLIESIPSMQYLLTFLERNTNLCFEIAGHINQPGPIITSGHRFDLAIKRAKTIYEYLVKNNIDPNRMYYRGYSNEQMLYPNPKNETEQKANRRVEIIIKDCNEIKKE